MHCIKIPDRALVDRGDWWSLAITNDNKKIKDSGKRITERSKKKMYTFSG